MSETTEAATTTNVTPLLSDKVYNILKQIVTIVLPALSTLYFALGGIWGWPYVDAVVGTIAAVTVFLGALIGVSSKTYTNTSTGTINLATGQLSTVQPLENYKKGTTIALAVKDTATTES